MWWESYQAMGMRREVKGIQEGGRTHKCIIRVPTMMSGKARYEEGAFYRDVAKPSTTLLALTTACENPDNTIPRKKLLRMFDYMR